MPRASIPVEHFSGGERGSLSAGRIDVQGYNQSLSTVDNFVPLVEGPILKRPGTRQVSDFVLGPDSLLRQLIPYTSFNATHYMLEFRPDYLDIYDGSGALIFSGGIISIPNIQDWQWALNGDLLVITNGADEPYYFSFDGNTPTIALSENDCGPLNRENVLTTYSVQCDGLSGQYDARLIIGGVPTPLALGTGSLLGFRTIPQSLYDNWTSGTAYVVDDYVWSQSYESSRVNVYKATTAGVAGTRTPGHDLGIESDGAVNWEMIHSEYGFARVVVAATGGSDAVLETVCFPEIPADATGGGSLSGNGTFRFSFGAWADNNGPAAVTFHEGRAVFGGGNVVNNADDNPVFSFNNAVRFWGSKIDAFNDFYPGIDDNDAYDFSVSAESGARIVQLFSGKELFLNTTGGFFSAPVKPAPIPLNRCPAA